MQTPNETSPSFFDTVRWPLIVAALLLGHMSLMLVVFTFASAVPPRLVEGAPYAAAPQKQTGSIETRRVGK